MLNRILLIFITFIMITSCQNKSDQLLLFVGSYADASEGGISAYDFNEQTGDAKLLFTRDGILNPSYLTFSSNGKTLYAVSETAEPEAKVYAYDIDYQSQQLIPVNNQEVHGSAPCYIWTDKNNTLLATANYNGGSVSVFPINADGSIASESQCIIFEGGNTDSERQQQPHLHGIFPDNDEAVIYATDLGTDQVYAFLLNPLHRDSLFQLDNTCSFSLPAGEGPRHVAFHPAKSYLYILGELSGNITVLQKTANQYSPIQTIVADSLQAAGSADIHISPDGRFLYASNRLQGDGLAIFSINPETGLLTKIGYQPTKKHPRNFVISPNGHYLLCASRDENAIQIFKINPESGLLTDTGKEIITSNPVCLKLLPQH